MQKKKQVLIWVIAGLVILFLGIACIIVKLNKNQRLLDEASAQANFVPFDERFISDFPFYGSESEVEQFLYSYGYEAELQEFNTKVISIDISNGWSMCIINDSVETGIYLQFEKYDENFSNKILNNCKQQCIDIFGMPFDGNSANDHYTNGQVVVTLRHLYDGTIYIIIQTKLGYEEYLL